MTIWLYKWSKLIYVSKIVRVTASKHPPPWAFHIILYDPHVTDMLVLAFFFVRRAENYALCAQEASEISRWIYHSCIPVQTNGERICSWHVCKRDRFWDDGENMTLWKVIAVTSYVEGDKKAPWITGKGSYLTNTLPAPENRPFNAPKGNEKIFQPSIFRCKLGC